jgi:Ca2+-binding RTX toxin-like protein
VFLDLGGFLAGLGYPPQGGAATGLTTSGFENFVGTNFKDVLTGTSDDNVFYPLRRLGPGETGFDLVYGGLGNDTLVIDYSNDDLANQFGIAMGSSSGSFPRIRAKDGVGLGTVMIEYSSIEAFHITGGNGPDTMYGELVSSTNDRFFGRGGNDHIEGRGGDDYIDGGEGNDFLDGGTGSDTIFGGPGNDHITFALGPGFDYGYGDDFADGGAGDDFISNVYGVNSEATFATPGNRVRLDGGPGFDTVSADAGLVTGPVVIEEGTPIHIDLPNGGYITNFERVRDLITGNFDDVILLEGRHNNLLSTRGGNDIVNPGLGIDTIWFGQAPGNTDNDLLILDYSKGDDPDLSGSTPIPGVAFASRRRISDNALVDSVTVISMERLHFTGSSKNDTITGGPKGNILLGGEGNDTLDTSSQNLGVSNWLDGGPGADIMRGYQGDDTYIVDNPGDVVTEMITWLFSGNDTVRASINYTYRSPSKTSSSPEPPPTAPATNSTTSSPEIPKTTSSTAAWATTRSTAAAARTRSTPSPAAAVPTPSFSASSAPAFTTTATRPPRPRRLCPIITDFTPSQNDRLRLSPVRPDSIFLGPRRFNPDETALYHDSNGNGVFDPESDELIAILQSPKPSPPPTPSATRNGAPPSIPPWPASISPQPARCSAAAPTCAFPPPSKWPTPCPPTSASKCSPPTPSARRPNGSSSPPKTVRVPGADPPPSPSPPSATAVPASKSLTSRNCPARPNVFWPSACCRCEACACGCMTKKIKERRNVFAVWMNGRWEDPCGPESALHPHRRTRSAPP